MEQIKLSAYCLWMLTNLMMQKDPHRMYTIDEIVRELKKFTRKGWKKDA